MGRRSTPRLIAAALALLAGLALPAAAAAHPLGNFTINHSAELRIAPDRADLDVVIDMAEIPAFQERQTMDADGDGSIADDEAERWAGDACVALADELEVRAGGAALALVSGSASVAFPPGAGGLSTLRLECGYMLAIRPPIGEDEVTLSFEDTSYAERIGWREIIATGVGTILETNGLPATSPSRKLTEYPADQLAAPLDIRSATIRAVVDPASVGASSGPSSIVPAAPSGPGGAVPGGVGGELPTIFRSADLTPFVLLASLVTAVAIGAGHALTPGHGKTLMAAYLVGSRGTAVHAVGLGLSVAVSHTLGILVLAFVILGAGSVLPPDVVYRVTPVIAAISIVAIGAWMLIGEVRRRRRPRSSIASVEHLHDHPGMTDVHDHGDGPEHRHDHGVDDDDHAAANGHSPPHDASGHDHPSSASQPDEHSHGGIRHRHLPPAEASLSWRGLFVLGLAGGLVPSTSALLILLGSIAAGRPAFGLVLVVAFGLGMAAVLTGVGLTMIVARGRLGRLPRHSGLGRLAAAAPLLASLAVLGLGLVLTWQALAGTPVL
ncbi:MAG: hypothetical protein H0U52_10790 [Chloroflexi bacterium]|nr:hypothetical protein [Chloroflexota bacterium]